MTAANGAEQFYQLDNNSCRTEDIHLARQIDEKTKQSWIGHPYFDLIDNSTDFDMKLARVLQVIMIFFFKLFYILKFINIIKKKGCL